MSIVCETCKAQIAGLSVVEGGKAYHQHCHRDAQNRASKRARASIIPYLPTDISERAETEDLNRCCKSPVLVVMTTHDNEVGLHGYEHVADAEKQLAEGYGDDSGWDIDSVYVNGTEVGCKVKVIVEIERPK